MRRVVVTGMGVVCPIGNNIYEMWNSIISEKHGFELINDDKINTKVVGRIKNFNLETYLNKRDISYYSKYINYARIAAKEAFYNASFNEEKIDYNKFGVIISSCIGGCEKISESYETNKLNSYYIPSVITSSASSIVAMDLKINGINMSINSACASGNNTIGEAYLKIKDGYQDTMIAGASEFDINAKVIDGFNAMRALYRGEDINKASIPFDKERSGFVLSEGAGVLVLEELTHALKRGAHIYAEIVGYGSNCDAYHIVAPEPEGTFASRAITLALRDANINASDIDYINTHGTSTIANDVTEINAIKKAFGKFAKLPLISSTKSFTGHMLSASGVIEAIICCKVLEEGFIPATIGTNEIDENCNLNILVKSGIRKDIKYVLSNSFGFGGDNACLIFKKWEK